MKRTKSNPSDCATGFVMGAHSNVAFGLTKYENAVIQLMAAMVTANDHTSPHHMDKNMAQLHAKGAIMLADAMFEELNKKDI